MFEAGSDADISQIGAGNASPSTSLMFSALALSFISGISTGIGGLIVLFFGKPKEKTIGFMLGFASGVMLYVSCLHLLPEVIEEIGWAPALFWMVIGMVVIYLIILCVPEPDPSIIQMIPTTDSKTRQAANVKLIMTGLVVTTGICLHNFPEGMAVYISCVKGWKLGIPIAVAIGMHNVPEGIAVACPIYAATGSKWQAVKWSVLSGLAEPLGAVLFGLFFHSIISEYMVHCMLSSVAGLMMFICAHELMPTTLRYINTTWTIISNLLGMGVLFVCSQLVERFEHSVK